VDRAIGVDVGLDVIFTTGLELNEAGESGFLAEDNDVVYDRPEGGSGKSSSSSRPGRDESGTPPGKGEEACGVVDNSSEEGVKVEYPGGVDIYE